MDLSMTVVTGDDAIIGSSSFDLVKFDLAELPSLIVITGLKSTAATSATEVIGFVRSHIYKILFPNYRFDNKAQIISNRISKAFSNYLARILGSKLNTQILIPV